MKPRPVLMARLPFLALAAPACSSLGSDLPEESPPLASMEEPPALFVEPADEDARNALPPGGYTGIHVADGRASLGGPGGLGSEPIGVLVRKVVENSPGDAAGVREGDLIIGAALAGGPEREIHWPSEWRAVELAATPGAVLAVVVDRAGVRGETNVVVAQRVRRPARAGAQRFREEQRVGVVLRTATEVEARTAGLAPGAGAVIVGLAPESPWRGAGLRFGDVITAVDGEVVAHPQVLLDAVREAQSDAVLTLRVQRRTRAMEFDAALSRREQATRRIALPPLFSYGAERGASELSILLGLIRHTTTAAAWEWRILWFIRFGGGDADRLEEVR